MKNCIEKSNIAGVLVCFSVFISSCATFSSGNSSPQNPAEGDRYSSDVFKVSEVAEKAYSENRWTDAARHYQVLTEQVPNDAYVWFRLANAYVQKGDFNQAINAYEKSIERDAMQPKPWFNLSTTYLLNAKAAMLQSWENLRPRDPAREIIMRRIQALDLLMNQDLGEIRVRGG